MSNEGNGQEEKIHRVGTVSLGIVLVGFGIAFLIRLLYPGLAAEQILQWWPVIMIVLGAEVLLAGIGKKNFVIDKAAVVLLFLVVFFLFGMAGAEIAITGLTRLQWQ
ncbi:MAG: hypothetical protein J6M66_09855 [Lachnospiraceae bacterium]|nr:hypothetical protein [Lachnospiraceae bacterium]